MIPPHVLRRFKEKVDEALWASLSRAGIWGALEGNRRLVHTREEAEAYLECGFEWAQELVDLVEQSLKEYREFFGLDPLPTWVLAR